MACWAWRSSTSRLYQDTKMCQLVITATVVSTQQTAPVLLAAPTTPAAWPSCGEQEGVTSVFPDNWQCGDLQMCIGLQQQSRGDGNCLGGRAKMWHRGESLGVIYYWVSINRFRKVKMWGDQICTQHTSFPNSALQLEAEAVLGIGQEGSHTCPT